MLLSFVVGLLRRFPGPAVYGSIVFFSLMLFGRYLISTTFGIFILSVILYFSAQFFSTTHPFTPQQLLLFIATQDKETSTAIFTSLLTVIGFYAAFFTSMKSWREQFNASIKFELSKQLNDFFNSANLDFLTLRTYAERVIELHSDKAGATDVGLALALRNSTQIAMETQSRITTHALMAPHILFSNNNLIGAPTESDKLNKAVQELSRAAYFYIISPDENLDAYIQYIKERDIQSYKIYLEKFDDIFYEISSLAGSICGYLLGKASIKVGFATLVLPLLNKNLRSEFISSHGKRDRPK